MMEQEKKRKEEKKKDHQAPKPKERAATFRPSRIYSFGLDRSEIYTDETGKSHVRANSTNDNCRSFSCGGPITITRASNGSTSLLHHTITRASNKNDSTSLLSALLHNDSKPDPTEVPLRAVSQPTLRFFYPARQAWDRTAWSPYERTAYMYAASNDSVGHEQQEQQQRVAVCLVGELRGFARSDITHGFASHLLSHFGAQLFVVGHAGARPGMRERHDVKGFTFWENVEAIRRLSPRLGVVSEFEDGKVPKPRRQLRLCGPWETAPHRLNCLPQLQHRNECMEYVMKAERQDRRRFHWVVSARPDLLFKGPIPRIETFSRKAIWTWAGDQIRCSVHNKDMLFILPREHAETFMMKAHNELAGCKERPGYSHQLQKKDRARICGCEPAGGCECALARFLARRRVPLGWFESEGVALDRKGREK